MVLMSRPSVAAMNATLLPTVVSLILVLSGFSGCSCSKYYAGTVVKKEERRSIVETEDGQILASEIRDGAKGFYHLQFITMEPNSLFLPVLLHADMVLFIRTGSGSLRWSDDKDTRTIDLRRGDLYRLAPGTVFHIQSNLETDQREKLRIHAIFSNTEEDLYDPSIGAYSSLSDLVQGFDKKILQQAFMVTEDVVEEILSTPRPPAIIHATGSSDKETFFQKEARFLKTYLINSESIIFNNKKKSKPYNVYDADPDFENCNGWSLTVTKKDLHTLKHSNLGVFMVNLTKGSMMGPHWNPRATEVSIVLQGEGMVRAVCSSTANESECRNMRFKVREGDVFVVPRFHPMAQMSYNNDSLVFMGFSTMTKKNYPQFLVGKRSVLQVLGREVLAAAFNVANATVDQLLAPQEESVILECTSCAEEEERIMEEEIEKEKKEEEEEEEREREEAAAARKREEEEEARKREEEEEEEEGEGRGEEERRRRQEEEQRRREDEEERERWRREAAMAEEEAARRQEEEIRRSQKGDKWSIGGTTRLLKMKYVRKEAIA